MSLLVNHPSVKRSRKTTTTPDQGPRFKRSLEQVASATEQLLGRLLGAKPLPGERERPKRLMEAMRYATLGGGKRLRPFLVVETARLCGAARGQALMVAAALECVHCYS